MRAFFPKDGVAVEDPVTGSLNASLAQWLLRSGQATAPYVARQGTALGRSGRVHITTDADGAIWVGGGTIACITGTVDIYAHAEIEPLTPRAAAARAALARAARPSPGGRAGPGAVRRRRASWAARRALYEHVLASGGFALVAREGETDVGYALPGASPRTGRRPSSRQTRTPSCTRSRCARACAGVAWARR